MRGKIIDHHILLNVVFVLPGRPNVSVEMVIDTGYVGTLTLPSTVIKSLGLPFLRRTPAKLADGSSISSSVHLATIVWHGFEQNVEVLVLEDRPLLGMLLLDGSQMNVHFENGGLVDVTELDDGFSSGAEQIL